MLLWYLYFLLTFESILRNKFPYFFQTVFRSSWVFIPQRNWKMLASGYSRPMHCDDEILCWSWEWRVRRLRLSSYEELHRSSKDILAYNQKMLFHLLEGKLNESLLRFLFHTSINKKNFPKYSFIALHMLTFVCVGFIYGIKTSFQSIFKNFHLFTFVLN